jgi:hypothetical protein
MIARDITCAIASSSNAVAASARLRVHVRITVYTVLEGLLVLIIIGLWCSKIPTCGV